MSNIILMSLIGIGVVTSFSFIYSVKKEFKVVEFSDLMGSEEVTNKKLEIKNFHSVKAYDQMKVFIAQGPYSVEVSAEDNLIDFVEVKNRDGVLTVSRIHQNGINIKQNLPMMVKITAPEFKSISSRNQSEILFDSTIVQDELSIDLEDQSNIQGDVKVNFLTLDLGQQSNAKVTGTTENLDISLSDQTGVNGGRLEANNVEIEMRNQANATLNAINSITGTHRGNGTLNLKGSPKENSVETSNQARIRTGI